MVAYHYSQYVHIFMQINNVLHLLLYPDSLNQHSFWLYTVVRLDVDTWTCLTTHAANETDNYTEKTNVPSHH